MADWVNAVPADKLGPGQHVIVDLDGVDVAVFNVDGEYRAFEDLCTHETLPLSDGPVEDGVITCPHHGAKFCLRSGEALCAPAYEPLTHLPTRVVDGIIQVRDDRWD
jgi:3-phenylpropionate/trans-cinnamate dioxygenase ferredoxin subunit